MPAPEFQQTQSESPDGQAAIHCDACRTAVHTEGQQDISFLLLDNLTIPIMSCDDHRAQFASICGLTTDNTATLLDHRPAGGICCPSCRLTPYTSTDKQGECLGA